MFRDLTLPGLSPSERHTLYVAMVRTLAWLHSINWRSLDLCDFGGKGNYAQRQISVWSNNYLKAVPSGDKVDKGMDHLMKWLPKNEPRGEQPMGKTSSFGIYSLASCPARPLFSMLHAETWKDLVYFVILT